jgi:hypothetical protein
MFAAHETDTLSFSKNTNANTFDQKEGSVYPVLLTPTRIDKMIAERGQYQVIKFRTTCCDCVPNL